MNKYTLSVVLAVHNEEKCLAACLRSVKNIAQEIIVVDGESTDKTVAVASEFKAKVIQTTNKAMFHTNKQMAIDAAGGDWILQLDADEQVDGEMNAQIDKLLNSESKYAAYWLKRKNYFLGGFLTKGGQYPDPLIRLFRQGKAYLPQKSVHEQMVVDGLVGQMKGHLLHYNAPTFKRYINNANGYTSFSAAQLKKRGVNMSLKNDLKYLFCFPIWIFGSLYFRHKGYRDGFRGFAFAVFSGLHQALAYMKLGDLYRKGKSESSH